MTVRQPSVLMFHNRYRSGVPSGENVSVHREVEVLRTAGWSVGLVETDSDQLVDASRPFLDRVRAAPRAVWNLGVAGMLDDAVTKHRPDIVHVQNDFPLLAPAIHHHLRRRGIPSVQSIRNYRFACVAASLWRDGSDCTVCVGRRVPLPGVQYRCGGSAARSAYVAAWMGATAATRARSGPLLLANSRYVAGLLLEHGADAGSVRHRHNLGAHPPQRIQPRDGRRGVVLAGRLDSAKGIVDFLATWTAQPPPGQTVTVFGDGPERSRAEHLAAADSSIRLRGDAAHADVLAAMASAQVVVVPSRWPEPFGRVALEALQHGTPALVTQVGGLPEVVGDITPQLVVPHGELMKQLRWVLTTDELPSPADVADHAEQLFGETSFVRRTREVYTQALQRSSRQESS